MCGEAMIYQAKLINLGMTIQEATIIMQKLHQSPLSTKKLRMEDAGTLMPVKCFDKEEVIAYLKTKKENDAIRKFYEVVKGY